MENQYSYIINKKTIIFKHQKEKICKKGFFNNYKLFIFLKSFCKMNIYGELEKLTSSNLISNPLILNKSIYI